MPLLDLTENEGGGFDAFSSGTYDAVVYEAKMDEIKNADGKGKLPAGTPMIKVQFKITGGPAGQFVVEEGKDPKTYEAGQGEDYALNNRRVFRNYIIPPKMIDGQAYEHYALMNGMLVRFLTALGYDEEVVTQPDFDLDLNDLSGQECRIVVGQKSYKDPSSTPEEPPVIQNEVKGVKPAGAPAVGGLI